MRLKVFLAGRIAVETEGSVIDERHFPGRQSRLLFAYLVAEHGRPVPRDELVDLLWGDAPPATWDKALSVHVSKLRAALVECGAVNASALSAAYGCYQLDLPEGTWIDVLAAEKAANEAEGFLETDDPESAKSAAALAESVTRGSFLPGDDGPWMEEQRRELAEVRARALSALAEASLSTDKPAEAVRWAGLAVEAEPFRESGYRRLMKAHVAVGNRAEALRVYERCRRFLAEELGTYPSPETEAIYRSLLDAPSGRAGAETPGATSPEAAPPPAGRRRRLTLAAAALVGLVILAVAGTAIAVVATRDDRSGTSSGLPAPSRVALVVPTSSAASDDPSAPYQDAIDKAHYEDGMRTKTFAVDITQPLPARVRRNIGKFGLVVLAGQSVDAKFTHLFARHPHTKFVAIDPDPSQRGPLYNAVSNAPNASDLFFIQGPGAYLAGYLGALMAVRHPRSSGKLPPAVSLVGSYPKFDQNVLDPFRTGATDAVPGISVFERESHDLLDTAACRRIANHQIDLGSRVVVADSGACSAGALEAAGNRGIWAIAGDEDPSNLTREPWILASTTKNFGQAVGYAIRSYIRHTLPPGGHRDIRITSGDVPFLVTNLAIPSPIRATLERVTRQHMKHWAKLGGLK